MKRMKAARAAAAILLIMASGLALPPAALGWQEALVLCTDYTSLGYAGILDRYDPWAFAPDVEDVGSDPVARWHDGRFYVVNRAGESNLQILDPDQGYQTVRQFSLGSGRNPQDIAFADGDAAFVSCLDQAVLLKVDVQQGSVLQSYSTAPWADADGLPETAWMQTVGDRLAILCQRLDRHNYLQPAGGSCVLIFDLAAETFVDADPSTPEIDAIDLAGENPYAGPELASDRRHLRVACTGFYGLLDGGIEVVDLTAGESLGFEVTEQELGGDVIDFASIGPDEIWAIVSDASADFATSLVRWRRGAGVEPLDVSDTWSHVSLAYDHASAVFVCDVTPGQSGVRVFATTSGAELSSAPISTGLAPRWVVPPLDEALVGVSDPEAGSAAMVPQAPRVQVVSIEPNPANPAALVRLAGSPRERVGLRIIDLRGLCVRRAEIVLDETGKGSYRFDGRDECGRDVASGVYHVMAGTAQAGAGSSAGGSASRLTIVR
jgi:hypothetical protein